MRAVVYDRYGPPNVLRIEEVPVPTPGPKQVLAQVAATSVNLSDWESLTGSPSYVRIFGPFAPKRRTLGSDIAGRVTAVGSDVTRFAEGDAVYGDNLMALGGFAEYALAPASVLAPKPPELTFAQASTLPQAGAIALQGTAGFAAGQRVLINGAGGGSGAFAIQLAKRAGAHVTGIDAEPKLDFMRRLGADDVGDHRRQDFVDFAPFDRILDLVATRSPLACMRALAPGGRYRCVGGAVRTLLPILTLGPILGLATGRSIGMMGVAQGPRYFGPLTERVLAGEVRVHIDRTFTLDEVPEALAYVGEGRALGKVVVTVRDEGGAANA